MVLPLIVNQKPAYLVLNNANCKLNERTCAISAKMGITFMIINTVPKKDIFMIMIVKVNNSSLI